MQMRATAPSAVRPEHNEDSGATNLCGLDIAYERQGAVGSSAKVVDFRLRATTKRVLAPRNPGRCT